MKINHVLTKPIQFLLEGEDAGTGNVALDAFGPPANGKTDEPETETETETGETETQAKPNGGIDHNALAESLRPVLEKLVPARAEPKQEEKKYTAEEAKKLLNIFEPDDDLIAKLHNVETSKEALAIIRDGLTKQNLTMFKMMMEEKFGEFDGKYSPLITAHQEQQAKAAEGRFHEKYPDLANEAYKPVINAVFANLAQSGQKFKSEAEIFDAAARGVEALIKTHNPDFKLTGAKAPTTKPGNPNALPAARPGAAKGGGGAKPSTTTPSGGKNVILEVMGKV